MAKRTTTQSSRKVSWQFPLRRQNIIILAIGIVILIIGYSMMLTAITSNPSEHQGVWNNPLAATIAPILLTIGYAIIIPYALLHRSKK